MNIVCVALEKEAYLLRKWAANLAPAPEYI